MTKTWPELQKEKERQEWDALSDEEKWEKYQELCFEYDQLYMRSDYDD